MQVSFRRVQVNLRLTPAAIKTKNAKDYKDFTDFLKFYLSVLICGVFVFDSHF